MYNLRLRPTQRAAVAALYTTAPTGRGEVLVALLGAGAAGAGAAGAGAGEVAFALSGEGDVHPAGVGAYRFSYTVADGSGYVTTFGEGVTQVTLRAFSTAVAAVVGVGVASAVLASAEGLGDRVFGEGAHLLNLAGAASGGTLPIAGFTYGTASAKAALSATGAGLSARMGAGGARVLCTGHGFGARGVEAQGVVALEFLAGGAGGRGVKGAGAYGLGFKGAGVSRAGVSGAGTSYLGLRAFGAGDAPAWPYGFGVVVVPFQGRGVGGRPIDYDTYDGIFIRSVEKQLFVVTQ